MPMPFGRQAKTKPVRPKPVSRAKRVLSTEEVNKKMLENEGLVFTFANKFWKKNKQAIQSKYGFNDVVQQGRLALRRAVVGFDEARGFQFSTFAVNVIKREFSRLLRKREMQEME